MKLTVCIIAAVAVKLLNNIILAVGFVYNHIQDTLHFVEGLYVLSAQRAFRSCIQVDIGVAERVAAVVALLSDVYIYEVLPLLVCGGRQFSDEDIVGQALIRKEHRKEVFNAGQPSLCLLRHNLFVKCQFLLCKLRIHEALSVRYL